MNNIKLVDKKICTGCGACYNICPKKAITMKPDEEGFLYPVIDETKCIDCGLCLKSCAAHNPQYENTKTPDCYAVWANDEIRMKSSSGGVFTLLANYVLDKGGYVCGAAWDKDFNVEHIIIHTPDELSKLRGSKYVQSNTKNIFKEIKKLLTSGEYVLFSGVPCQVAALKKYLDKDYSNLLTVDLICHGVPSPKVWQDYLREKGLSGYISDANFRPKEFGWGTNYLEFTQKNRKKRLSRAVDDPFMQGFKKSLFVRNSCASCSFVKAPRQADITLGDFWGIEHFDKYLNDGKGTSCVILNNEKGRLYFENIKENFILCKKVPFSFAYDHQIRLQKPLTPHPRRSYYFEMMQNGHSFGKSVDFTLNNKYDIGIVGIWFFENYGAILTAYALYKLLEKMGYTSILIDSSGLVNNEHLNDPHILSRRFMRRFKAPITSIKRSKQELSVLNGLIDNFVLASDQLWHYPKPYGKTFFLDFVRDDKRKVAIATSFGDGYIDPKSEWNEAKFHMQRLDRISVREDTGVDICRKIFGVKAEHILDPVFLCDISEYEKVIEKSKVTYKKPYLLSYILDTTPEKEEAVKMVAEKMGLELFNISDGDVLRKKDQAQKDIEVEDWLYYFKNAEAVITDSFHGTCFSMIFHKPFISIVNQARGTSRFTSLLKMFDMENRLFFEAKDIVLNIKYLKTFEVNRFKNILEKQKKRSLAWIQEALSFENNKSISTYDLLEARLSKIPVLAPVQTSSLKDNTELLKLLFNKDIILFRYLKYKILRKICFGKTRRHYKEKYKKYKEYKKQIKMYMKEF